MIRINKTFDLKMSLFSGQCFRMIDNNNSFLLIIKDRVLKIVDKNNCYEIYSNKNEKLKEVIYNYFDLNNEYNLENIKVNNTTKKIIDLNKNYKVFNQDPFEVFISYIISQNNNVKRISSSINKLCELYGKEIIFENNKYYLFPDVDKIINLKIEDLSELKIGFRDKYIINALNYLKENKNFLNDIGSINTNDAMDALCKIKGIGPKVASCILMFGYHRFDAYPIDTWAKKYFKKYYSYKSIKELQDKLYKEYGNNVGLIIQFIFNYERNISK